MPSEANDLPNTLSISLLRAVNTLDSLSRTLDALMFISGSDLLDESARGALAFTHQALVDDWTEARRLVEHARSLQAAG
jgi:hypothetical protein